MATELPKNHDQEPNQPFHLWAVDNELHHRQMLPLYANQHGCFTVRVFASPEDLLKAFDDPYESTPPDAIVLDYHLGNDLDGLETAVAIKESPRYARQPVVLHTDYPLHEFPNLVTSRNEQDLLDQVGKGNIFDKNAFYPHTLDKLQQILTQEPIQSSSRHILIVEIDSEVEAHADQWTQSLGSKLEIVSRSNPVSVLEFLDKLRPATPTLIAINHDLGNTRTSFELAEDIRLLFPQLQDTPIVIYTNNPNSIKNHPAVMALRLTPLHKTDLTSYLKTFAAQQHE